MKTVHYDGKRLAAEICSGSLVLQWFKLIFAILLGLGLCGGIVAQNRSIRCEKIEPPFANCQIADTLFWGAIQRVQRVSAVQHVILDQEIGYSDASQYPIYRVFLVLNHAQEVPVTDWERNFTDAQAVKNSLDQFLRSEATTYTLDLYNFRNLWGAILFAVLLNITILSLMTTPYQIRLIADKTTHQAILIRQFFLLGTRRKFFSLDQLTLRLEEEKDSDDDRYYRIYLDYSAPPQGSQQHTLQSSRQKSDIQEYWQTNPDLQLLKGFVRCEEKWLG